MKRRAVHVVRALTVLWAAGASAIYVGCSSQDEAPPQASLEAGVEAAPAFDGYAPPVDASVTVPFDSGCPDAGDEAPDELRCTGLYSDWGAKTVDPLNRPYTPGAVLWSDGARKSRYLYLPPGSKIDTSDMDQWSFPVGTRVWKEFAFDGQRVETRFYEKTAAASTEAGAGRWTWGTYRWSADQSTATLVTEGVADAGPNSYSIPARRDCPTCHAGGRRDSLLGVEAVALGLASATGETLAALQAAGRFTVNPPATTVQIPDDHKGSAAALGYLHINCGVSCHNPNPASFCAISGLFMRLSANDAFAAADGGASADGGAVDGGDGGDGDGGDGDGDDAVRATPTYRTAVRVAPTVFTVRFPPASNWFRIAPGDVSMSEIPTVFAGRGTQEQMPPIATHVVDDAGVELLSTWIQALP